jgi:hypothetical protein
MASQSELMVSRALRAVLADLPDGAIIPESRAFSGFLSVLEDFLTETLRDIHPEWEFESLDGVLPALANKSAPGEADLLGLCILITDQSLVPMHLRLQHANVHDSISWFDCKFGEEKNHRMNRVPWGSRSDALKRLYLPHEVKRMNWFYHVTYGRRRT